MKKRVGREYMAAYAAASFKWRTRKGFFLVVFWIYTTGHCELVPCVSGSRVLKERGITEGLLVKINLSNASRTYVKL